MEVSIGFDNFEILKIDDRDFTVEINAYLIADEGENGGLFDKIRQDKLENLRIFSNATSSNHVEAFVYFFRECIV